MSRRKRRSKGNGGAIAIVVGLVLLILAIVASYIFIFLQPKVELNAKDFCPVDGPSKTVSILLDPTINISNATKLNLRSNLIKEIDGLDRYAKIQLFFISENGVPKQPEESYCNPGNLEQQSWTDKTGVTANPKLIKARTKKFKESLVSTLNRMITQGTGLKFSPLLEALQITALSMESPQAINGEGGDEKNKIILVSDLRENTEYFSVYKKQISNPFSIKRFRKSPALDKFRFDGEDIEIDILFINQNDGFKYEEITNFWEQVLTEDLGLTVNRWVRLAGEM
jgi:hypothetical protein